MNEHDRSQPAADYLARGMATVFAPVLAALGLLAYATTFARDVPLGFGVVFLLSGGLLAVLQLLPDMAETTPYATMLSVVGGLLVLSGVAGVATVSGPTIVLILLAVLQTLTAVAALLLERGLVKSLAAKLASIGDPDAQPQPAHSMPHGHVAQPSQFDSYPPSLSTQDLMPRHMRPPESSAEQPFEGPLEPPQRPEFPK